MNDTLTVPGAELYYTVSGSGPTLLLICGGVYDADAYGGLASQLVDRYTVVTYDRRGNSRSPLDGPPTPQTIEVHADDAHRILAATSPGHPAYVFGNSSGAMIALELATRHPEQVRVVVAHERRPRWLGPSSGPGCRCAAVTTASASRAAVTRRPPTPSPTRPRSR